MKEIHSRSRFMELCKGLYHEHEMNNGQVWYVSDDGRYCHWPQY